LDRYFFDRAHILDFSLDFSLDFRQLSLALDHTGSQVDLQGTCLVGALSKSDFSHSVIGGITLPCINRGLRLA
jgi:hypothetical protein